MRNCDNSEHQRKASKARWARQKRTFKDRYLDKITKGKEQGDCWIAKKPGATGYGSVEFEGKTMPLHRASWEIYNGEIPEGLCVLHICDVRACSNPKHLYLGDKKQNRKDFMERHPDAKNLVAKGQRAATEGTKNFWAKMTKEEKAAFCAKRAARQKELRNANASI